LVVPKRNQTSPQRIAIAETFLPKNQGLKGRNLGELAKELGKTPFDTLCDLAVEEDLKTSFMPFIPGDDEVSWGMRAELWKDPRTVVGASDAGAHLDMINTFMYSTALLGPGVREKGLLTLEEAVHQLTDVPARLYGVRERGRIEPGWHADVTIFDADTVGHSEMYVREDLPAGAARLYSDAKGVDHVLVGGTPVVRGGEATGARPGTVLRSGRDTETVTIPGAA